jgi:hypothetical protein
MEKPDLGSPDIRIHYVRVTNHATTAFTDRHDGVPVRLDPGASDNLPLDMAAHMFGYGYGVDQDTMFRHVCKRQGWNTPRHLEVQASGKTLAQENFAKLEIKPVIYKMVEERPNTDAPIPADPMPNTVADVEDLPPLPKRVKAGAS